MSTAITRVEEYLEEHSEQPTDLVHAMQKSDGTIAILLASDVRFLLDLAKAAIDQMDSSAPAPPATG